jgi:uroporphyrinogen-III synthase
VDDLSGFTVVITRPEHQAQNLTQLVQNAGGAAILFPLLAIDEPRHPQPAIEIARALDRYDLAIFISANAVEHGLRYVDAHGHWPQSLRIAAVGAATARALQEHHRPAAIVPADGYNSEALLAHPELQNMHGKRVVIFRGEGGRELLGDTLKQRGAQVDYAEVYRRTKPPVDSQVLLDAWQRSGIDAIVVTSNESLQNLFDLVGPVGQAYLQRTQLVVMSERAAELARQLGVTVPARIVTPVSDAAILAALVDCARRRGTA